MATRTVYYLSGFDPRGASFYHRLIREQSRKSAALSGINYLVGKRNNKKLTSEWSILARANHLSSEIDYRFLVWDDVIRQFWIASVWQLILSCIPMYWAHFKCRLFRQFKAAGRGPYICSLYPVWIFSTGLFISCIGSVLAYQFSSLILPNWLNVLLGLTTLVGGMLLTISVGDKMGAWWILQTYHFIARWGQAPIPSIETKLDAFAQQIIQDHKTKPEQDILLAGHCVGSILSISLLSRLLLQAPPSLIARLKLLTLGQCIPYLTYIPTAAHYRASMQNVINQSEVRWIDIGARIDPLCFDQVNPSIAKGITPKPKNSPMQYVIRPSEMYTTDTFQRLKHKKLQMHFQYLMASELPVAYDYFEIVTDPNYDFSRLEKSSLKNI